MTRRRILAVLTVCGLLGTAVPATQAQAASSDPDIPTLQDIRQAGGLGVLSTARTAHSVRSDSLGTADLRGSRVQEGSHFRAASITKAFVATAVMQQVERGRIQLDDPLETYLPGALPYGSKITVRQILSHTSGFATGALEALQPLPDLPPRQQLAAVLEASYSPTQLLGYAAKTKPKYAPGSRWEYSNINFTLAALILEAVTHRPVRQVVKQQILKPLRLRNTSFVQHRATMRKPSMRGYLSPVAVGEPSTAPRPDVTRQRSGFYYGSGNMVSTTGDIAAFFRGLLSGKLVNRQTLKQMTTTTEVSPSYGLGLLVLKTPCGNVIGHDGSVLGYDSIAFSLGGKTVVNAATTDGSWPRTDPTSYQPTPQFLAFLKALQFNALGRLCPQAAASDSAQPATPVTGLRPAIAPAR